MSGTILLSENETGLIDAITAPSAIIDNEGVLVYVNRSWKSYTDQSGFFGESITGGDYFEVCEKAVNDGSDYALKLIMGIRDVLDGKEKFQFIFPSNGEKSKKWFNVLITPLNNTGVILQFHDTTESVLASDKLRDSEERYKQQFDHSLNGIIIGTPDGIILDVNSAACSYLGYTKQEIIEGGRELVVAEDHPINIEAEKIRKEKSFYEGEKVYRHKSGREIIAEVSSVLYRDREGKIIHMNTFRDITEQKIIEDKLEEQRHFNQIAIDSVPGTFYVINENGEFVEWNNAFYSDLGFTDEEMRSMKPGDFFHKDDRNKVLKLIKDIFGTGDTHEVVAKVHTKQKGIRHFKMNGSKFEAKDGTYLVGTGLDVTDLVEAEFEREKNMALMSQLFENSPLGIVMINENGIVERVNQGFLKMFGYFEKELLDRDLNKLITSGGEYMKAEKISELTLSGITHQTEGYRKKKDGTEIPVLINSVPVKTNGKIKSCYGIYVDLSEQKNLESRITELLEKEKDAKEELENSLRVKEILLQEVHHRVKNNLAVIAGLIDLQLMEESNANVIKKLSQIHGRVFSIAKIHETLYQENNITCIRFNDYVKSFLDSYSQAKIDFEDGLPLHFDLQEVELNLNQAVPFGLLLNELMGILLTDVNECSEPVNIALSISNDGYVSLEILGECLNICNLFVNRDSDKFEFAIIKILLGQLNGELNESAVHKGVNLRFRKRNIRGSSSSFVQKLNI